jgi:hypothetical protein
MMQIKPNIDNTFQCPNCEATASIVNDIELHATYSLADCKCGHCKLEFLQTLPIGHCVNDRVSVRKSDDHVYGGSNPDFWVTSSLRKSRAGMRNKEVTVRKIVHESRKEVVVLNTLDYLYGHVLLKLYNYQHHLRNNLELGLIVIVPKAFEWLVPAEASEAWIVDLSLGELAFEHPSLTAFIKNEFQRYDKIWLSHAWSHPDFTKIDMKQMTGIAPFNLDFYTSEIPTFTFVLREDRWWLKSKFGYWMYRVGRRVQSIRKMLYRAVSSQQEALVRQAIREVRRQIPEARFFVTGIGNNKGFEGLALDTRTRNVNEEKELEWCRVYSHSHVVIGFHGSNMLLPTAFSAGCVEILPEDRYGNMLQDISVRYNDRRQSFFYRFSDQYSRPASVAAKAVAMIRDYEEFTTGMCVNQYKDKSGSSNLKHTAPDVLETTEGK